MMLLFFQSEGELAFSQTQNSEVKAAGCPETGQFMKEALFPGASCLEPLPGHRAGKVEGCVLRTQAQGDTNYRVYSLLVCLGSLPADRGLASCLPLQMCSLIFFFFLMEMIAFNDTDLN